MASVKISKHIEAPRDVVFDVCSDFPNAAENVAGITKVEMLTEGSVNVGTRFKETRIMFGREATEEMEVIQFQPNEMYCVAADSCGARFETTFRFSDENEGTRIEMDMDVKPTSFFAKLMSPLSKMMMGSVKKCIEGDLESIAAAAHSRSSQSA